MLVNSGWMPYGSSKAALTRFINCLAHEEDENHVKVQGVYPRVTRTAIAGGMINGRYRGIMKDEEIEKFLAWDREGSKVEPPDWCGRAVGLLAADAVEGCKHAEVEYYDVQVQAREYKL